jgi:hypothetical protein
MNAPQVEPKEKRRPLAKGDAVHTTNGTGILALTTNAGATVHVIGVQDRRGTKILAFECLCGYTSNHWCPPSSYTIEDLIRHYATGFCVACSRGFGGAA